MSAIKDANKGYDYLIQALKIINRNDVELIVFGNSADDISINLGFKINYLGYLDTDEDLTLAYSAANVMVVPSIQESFGQTAMESMSCGTPVVSFDTTGLRDIIDHLKNGYLAKSFSPNDLAAGINWVLDFEDAQQLRKSSIEKVKSSFDSVIVYQKMFDLYKSVLEG